MRFLLLLSFLLVKPVFVSVPIPPFKAMPAEDFAFHCALELGQQDGSRYLTAEAATTVRKADFQAYSAYIKTDALVWTPTAPSRGLPTYLKGHMAGLSLFCISSFAQDPSIEGNWKVISAECVSEQAQVNGNTPVKTFEELGIKLTHSCDFANGPAPQPEALDLKIQLSADGQELTIIDKGSTRQCKDGEVEISKAKRIAK